MYLKYVQITNFRNLKATRFNFAEGANTIIGENDVGKSNAVTAMRILLDSDFFYNTKRLKETDFSFELDNWRGHWIIISAFFDKMTNDDKITEVCSEMIPEKEDEDFLKSFIRCEGYDYGVVTLFIRPNKQVRSALYNATDAEAFSEIRKSINLTDYEFVYTSRSQADFTNDAVYKRIVGDIENGEYADPDEMDMSVLGAKIDILDVWSHVSMVFIDALRDVDSELHKPKNPIRRIIDTIQSDIDEKGIEEIQKKIRDLNDTITNVKQISEIGIRLEKKMDDIVGALYSPEITLESRIKEDLLSISKNLSISTKTQQNIDLFGLGHLNILYVALKLVEFEYNRNHEVLNIMIIEEPEAHIHTHIQKTLFDKLQLSIDYTQVIMTTHSTHISEISDLRKVNIMQNIGRHSLVMQPINGLDEFGKVYLNIATPTLSKRLERYLDAKRSVLLFSRGVILVEGDAEEILIPAMVKKAFGVSLDELGIGLINIGSVSFEYVACIFDKSRIQRCCAILTDTDAVMDGAQKTKTEAAKRGESRKEKLELLFGNNKYVNSYFSEYTFEIDLFEIEENRHYLEQIIKEAYKKEDAVKMHLKALKGTAAERYDSILTIAERLGKGWLATNISTVIDCAVCIPDYIIEALAFSGKQSLSFDIVWKMFVFTLDCYNPNEDDLIDKMKEQILKEISREEREDIIREFCKTYAGDNFSRLMSKVRRSGN